jgi:hypothetical protein
VTLQAEQPDSLCALLRNTLTIDTHEPSRLLAGFADGIAAFAHPGCPLSCTAFWSHHQGPLKAAAASTAVASPSCAGKAVEEEEEEEEEEGEHQVDCK